MNEHNHEPRWGIQNTATLHWVHEWTIRRDGSRRTPTHRQCLRYCRALNRRHESRLFVVDLLPENERGN